MPVEVKVFPERFPHTVQEELRWTMLLVLFSLRALKSPWNSATFLWAAAGGSKGASGSEGVPRKSSETFRGTVSVDDDLLFIIIAGRRFSGIAGGMSCSPIGFRILR